MLTPVEIQNRGFKSAGLGYDKKDVDVFMSEIIDSYEELYREKIELDDKINVLNDRLQYYKTIEKTMQKALLLAQKTAEETQESAMRAARNIEKEAMTKAEIAINDARRELDMIHQRTVQLAQQYEKYKLQFKNLAISQIELLETESYQIHIMDIPEITMPEPAPMAEKTYYAAQEDAASDFSFTNVASEEE